MNLWKLAAFVLAVTLALLFAFDWAEKSMLATVKADYKIARAEKESWEIELSE